MAVFKTSSLQSTIKTYSPGNNFAWSIGFCYLFDSNTTFYVSDAAIGIITIFDANWNYLAFKSFKSASFMIAVNNSLYISGNDIIYKTDKYLNILCKYNNSLTATYRGLHFNSLNNTIYVAGFDKNSIFIFDLNLNLVDSMSTQGYQPYSIQRYKNYIYVGTNSGQFLAIENKVIIKTVSVCAGTVAASILIDHFGYMATNCFHINATYLYYSENVSYTGMSLTYAVKPWFIQFDLNGRFVLISPSQINIYY